MRWISRFLARQVRTTDEAERGVSRLQASTRERTRRELISMALRDTLKKHDLAAGCITVDALPSVTATKHRGMHIQMVFRDWQPSLLAYVVALESAVRSRLQRLDPLSSLWITGVSWRFEPQDRTVWPQLPVPGPKSVRVSDVSKPDPGATAERLGRLLRSGDVSFTPGRHATVHDFSPTLPMHK